MAYTLPALPYEYSALEPHIDTKTMELHHDKHHATYVQKLNDALVNNPDLTEMPVTELLKSFANLPEALKTAVKNHGGGHANHTLFWEIMTPDGSKTPTGKLAEEINKMCTDYATFMSHFTEKSLGLFGSGWTWLVVKADKSLEIITFPNQDSPYMLGYTPIMGVDVWEHAYYLKYQNVRAEYLKAWWNLVNWDVIAEKFAAIS